MNGQSILITGCSSGIGEAAAFALKERGYQVFAAARQAKDVQRLQEKGLLSVQLDVTDQHSMEQALAYVLSQTGGHLYALFNNAGFLQAGAVEDLTPEIILNQFQINTFGPIALTNLVLPIMRKQGYGRIIQNSSILGLVAFPYYGAYNASKFALEGFSDTLRRELRAQKQNIFVSTINPGPIQSKLRKNAYDYFLTSVGKTQHSDYQQAYKDLEVSYFKNQTSRLQQTPNIVINKLIHALESKHPKAHYIVGVPAQFVAFLHRFLPERMFDWMVNKMR